MSVELLQFFCVLFLTITVLGSIVLINKNHTLRQHKKRLDFYLEKYYKALETNDKLTTSYQDSLDRLEGLRGHVNTLQSQIDGFKRLTVDKGGQDEKSTSDPS